MNHPQPRILAIWRITLTLVTMLPAFLVSLLLKRSSTAWLVSIIILALLYLFMFLVYFPQLYKKMSYSISDERIVYITGVFSTRVITVPVSGIQFVSVSQSVFAKMFGLASVIATLAGGRVVISGLNTNDAESIASLLQSHKE